MAKLYNISGWSEQPWWNTGGTRNKKVYLNPDNDKLYYFKQSYIKGAKNYEYEFWSEIVASEIGRILGFDLLPYHVAIRGDIVGCISESMIDPASQELVEGGKYLQAFDNTFEPEDRLIRNRYDFQLIEGALSSFGLDGYIGNIIDTILFDAIIGNSDRHQENWALINTHSNFSRTAADLEKALESGGFQQLKGWGKKFIEKIYMKGDKVRPEIKQVRYVMAKEKKFAPIYDSGCSFGRELLNKKVRSMLSNTEEIERYLDKGKAEIHWSQKKISHFDLLQELLNSDYQAMLLASIDRMLKNYDQESIENAIQNIDAPLIKERPD